MTSADVDRLVGACAHLPIEITSAIITPDGCTIEVRDNVNRKRWEFDAETLKPKVKSCSKRVQAAIQRAAEIAGDTIAEIVECAECAEGDHKGWLPSYDQPGRYKRCPACKGTGRKGGDRED